MCLSCTTLITVALACRVSADTVNPYFGSAQDLAQLSAELHARGMWLMVDVVGNHMGTPPNGDVSQFSPFNNTSHYHDCSM